MGQAWRDIHRENASLIRQTFRKLGLSLAIDGSEDNELSIKDIPDVKVGEWRLSAGQEDIQEVEEPDTVDNIQKAGDEVQIEDRNEFVLEGKQVGR